EHYLDYFHCSLVVSPGQTMIADAGWVWHPVGIVTAWSLERWLGENVWESEDGPSRQRVLWRDYYWGGPMCWLDERRLAVWGYGNDDEWQIDGVRTFDVTTNAELAWFPGPRGELIHDRVLASFGDDAKHFAIWDVATGARLAQGDASPTH